MFMINCSKEKYLKALAERVPTEAEYKVLQRAAVRAKIAHVGNGRQISPRFWLQALRSDTRNKLALTRLATTTCKCMCDAAKDAAMMSQHLLLAELQRECPAFFAGMLVPDEEVHESNAAGEAAE